MTPKQRADLRALTTRMEQEKAARERTVTKPKHSRKWLFAGGVAVIAACLVWIYPGPQMRAAVKLKQEQAAAQRHKEEVRRELEIERQVAQQREREKHEIATATKEQLITLVTACQDGIRKKLSGSPFEVYFTRYKASDFDTVADLSQGMGMSMGRPSAALDNYDFDPVNYNVAMLSDPKSRDSWTISFVIEHASDGFSIRQYAALWECPVNGLTPNEPREERRVLF